MKNIFKVWITVLVLWFIYRYLLNFPETIDELLAKPIIFVLVPTMVMGLKMLPGFEKWKTFFTDLTIGVFMGFVFAVVSVIANKLKYGELSFYPTIPMMGFGIISYLVLSIFTSFSEEVLGRGIFFANLRKELGLIDASAVASMLSLSLYLPILFIRIKPDPSTLIVFLISSFVLSVINSILYSIRGNIVLPILLHAFWNMSVVLYL